APKKILPYFPASPGGARASSNEAGFNVSFPEEDLDLDDNSRPPNGGADQTAPNQSTVKHRQSLSRAVQKNSAPSAPTSQGLAGNHDQMASEILELLKLELGSSLQVAATRAAAVEHNKTRQWLETAGLPKVARVAQREAYNILRKHGLLGVAQ